MMSSRSRARCYVGRLKEGEVSSKDMEMLFGKFGRLVDIQLKSNYGFVEFDNDRAADDAVLHMNRTEFMGDRIIVEHARDDTKLRKTGPPPPPVRGRSPSPPRYDSMPTQRSGLFASGYSDYPAPPQSSYNMYNNQFTNMPRSSYPSDPMPPYRGYDLEPSYLRDPVPSRWSPPRGPRRRSRSRSRSRSPLRNKRIRRSSPLRIIRRRTRSRSPVRSPRDSTRRGDKDPSEKTTARSPWRICVEGLTSSTTWQDLRRHFDEIGQVVYASVASDASGFVEFTKRDMVAQAIEKLNNTYLKGVRIQVVNSIPPEDDVEEPEAASENDGKNLAEPREEKDLNLNEDETEVIPHASNGLDDEEQVAPDFSTNGNGADVHEGESEAVAEAIVEQEAPVESNGHE